MTKHWQSIALLAGAIVVFGCATMSTVKSFRAPSVIGVEIDTSCHIADTVRVWVDHVLVSNRAMRPHDQFEMAVADGVHTIAARSTPPELGLAWTWPLSTVTIPAGERYIAVLRCPAAVTSPLTTFLERWAK